MKKAICILCNNTRYLQAFIDNYNQKDEDLIIINEVRIGDKTKEIKEIVKDKRCIVISSEEVISKLKEQVVDTPFVNEYTMGMNILYQWYVFKFFDYDKVIFSDDDVLYNDLEPIYNSEKSLFYIFALSAGGKTYDDNSSIYKNLIKSFCEVYDLDINKDNYREAWRNNHISSGQKMYVRNEFQLEEYEKYLKRFFENQYIRYLWTKRNRPQSYYLDEWFEGLFLYKTNIINDELKKQKLVYLEIRNDNKIDFNKYTKNKECCIWHNATCQHKRAWLEKLKEHGCIN